MNITTLLGMRVKPKQPTNPNSSTPINTQAILYEPYATTYPAPSSPAIDSLQSAATPAPTVMSTPEPNMLERPDEAAPSTDFETLLRHALDARDTAAAVDVTQRMDDDDALDARLTPVLENALETQPDAVYFVIRAHLNQIIQDAAPPSTHDQNPHYTRWLPRLQAAALYSLRVAIEASDVETLTSWLKLIVREPEAYQLHDVLHQGILAAQERTHHDGALGYQLLVFAAKKAPESLDMLLDDPELLNALPDSIAHALRDHDPLAIQNLVEQSRILYMLALGRAADVQQAEVFTPEVIDTVWQMVSEEQACPVPESYQPQWLLDQLLSKGMEWLSDETRARLLMLVLKHPLKNKLIQIPVNDVVKHTVEHDPTLFTQALNLHIRPTETLPNIVNAITDAVATGTLTPQQMVETFVYMLNGKLASKAQLPLAEHIARTLQQHSTITIPLEKVWKLLQVAAEARSEMVARVMTKRILHDLAYVQDDRQLCETFLRLCETINWNVTIRQLAVQWWREFILDLPLSRLQDIVKWSDPKKIPEDVRETVRTALGFRKLFSKYTLEEFGDMIRTTHYILNWMSETFDPAPKQPAGIDSEMCRLELAAHENELNPDERRVIASNLKELGNLLVEMSEHRSKASLIRREDEVERQLMSGEQQPQSAIDLMKWMSGYLDGIQDEADTEA